ncbi:MAG: hypothetical protein HS101_18415 [Planctomycetia bacterium]|nr:hypothetical protein [Planctomycetia bacterium]
MSDNAIVSIRDVISAILKHDHFVDALVTAMDADPAAVPTITRRELHRQDIFHGLVGRVVDYGRGHPQQAALKALFEDTGISDEGVFDAVEFVSSCLINHFKGEIAELLARPLLHQFALHLSENGIAPAGAELILGHEIRSKRLDGSSGWHKSADAMLLTTTDRWATWTPRRQRTLPSGQSIIVGLAEIKAYRQKPNKLFDQLANHANRFQRGMLLRGIDCDLTATFIAQSVDSLTADCVPLTSSYDARGVSRLAILPRVTTREEQLMHRFGPNAWISELPFTSQEMLEAAYRFSIWLACLLGTNDFGVSLATNTAESHAQLREATLQGGLQDRFLEVLYHLCHRKSVANANPEHSGKLSKLYRLYNSFSYGRRRAVGSRMQWPDEHPELPRAESMSVSEIAQDPVSAATAQCLFDSATAYGHGNLRKAQELLEMAKLAGTPPAVGRKLAWLESMIAYRDGRFAVALELFPGPNSDKNQFWWPRDQLMWARLHARACNAMTARTLLTQLEPLGQWPIRALPIEYFGVSALTFLAGRENESAKGEADRGIEILEAFRYEVRERQSSGLGEPVNIHTQVVQMGVFDLVAVLVRAQRAEEAVNHLVQLSGFDGWEIPYLIRDELLAELFNNIKRFPKLLAWVSKTKAW